MAPGRPAVTTTSPRPAALGMAVALCLAAGVSGAAAQVYDVRHLDAETIRGLDRERTVVLLPGGIIEEHRPYLPTYSDGFMNERHNRALDQAGDWFHDEYGGEMVHLAGLMPVFQALGGTLTPEQRAEEGLSVHAGLEETGIDLFLRPDLVGPDLEEARTLRAEDTAGLVEVAHREGWPGYFGAPRLASAAQGAEIWSRFSGAAVGVAMDILDGLDPREVPRYADLISRDPVIAEVNRDALRHDAALAARQRAWLEGRGIP